LKIFWERAEPLTRQSNKEKEKSCKKILEKSEEILDKIRGGGKLTAGEKTQYCPDGKDGFL